MLANSSLDAVRIWPVCRRRTDASDAEIDIRRREPRARGRTCRSSRVIVVLPGVHQDVRRQLVSRSRMTRLSRMISGRVPGRS